MKSIRFRLLLATMAALLGSALARSQDADTAPPLPMHGHHMGMGGHMGFFARELNLTDAQKAQMKSIMQKEHPTMKPLFQQQHQIELQLRQYVEGSYDEAKVRTLAAQKAQVQSELTVQETRIHNQLYQILTADQQSKLKEIEAQHEARMQKHLQNTSGPPQE